MTTKQKTTFLCVSSLSKKTVTMKTPYIHFLLKSRCLSPKIGKKKLLKSVSGYYKTKKKKKKTKWHGPLCHWCWERKTLVVRPLKKHFFFVCLPLPPPPPFMRLRTIWTFQQIKKISKKVFDFLMKYPLPLLMALSLWKDCFAASLINTG
jgi:hypothetical protein